MCVHVYSMQPRRDGGRLWGGGGVSVFKEVLFILFTQQPFYPVVWKRALLFFTDSPKTKFLVTSYSKFSKPYLSLKSTPPDDSFLPSM